jgi:hypothetical protein
MQGVSPERSAASARAVSLSYASEDAAIGLRGRGKGAQLSAFALRGLAHEAISLTCGDDGPVLRDSMPLFEQFHRLIDR